MGNLSLDDYEDVHIDLPYGQMVGRWYGNRKDRPILALHGWLDNLGSFDTLIPLLPDYLGVLCIDLPGHGLSSSLPTGMHYSADDWVLIISRVMKAYKWEKVSLMGHSMSGFFSFVHTALAPQTVDMVIILDFGLPPFDSSDAFPHVVNSIEKYMLEEDRTRANEVLEPPSYSMAQLRKMLSNGTFNSVPEEFAQHLLNRSVTKSKLYPEKFYYFRDGRTKFYTRVPFSHGKGAELARRIRDKPYLIIKGSDSPFIDSKCEEVFSILAANNPHFEFHEVAGMHHVHLSNAAGCAKYIVPFLRRHRPPPADSESRDVQNTLDHKGKL